MCSREVDLRRAPPVEICQGIFLVTHGLPPAHTAGQGDILGRDGEIPPEGPFFLIVAAQACGAGLHAQKVALGSLGGVRQGRAPLIRF